MIKLSLYLLRDLWVSQVINRPIVWEMGNQTFLQQKSKKLGQFFQIENFWRNSMCVYLGRTGYLTPILHCQQWENT